MVSHPSPRTPKHDSLAWAFVCGAASSAAAMIVFRLFLTRPTRLPPAPPVSSAQVVVVAALCGALAMGICWLANRHRTRTFRPRGSCWSCGYDRGTLEPAAPCPECGSRLPPVR